MLNELKGKMLELIVYRELNRSKRERQSISNFQQRLRTPLNPQVAEHLDKLLMLCSTSQFDTIWMNHYVQLPGMTAEEIDVLAEGSDANHCWALVFEVKNRAENNLPSMKEAQSFVAKVAKLTHKMSQTGKSIKFLCPVYLSAEGFDCKVETWLQEQGILTTDMVHWEKTTSVVSEQLSVITPREDHTF